MIRTMIIGITGRNGAGKGEVVVYLTTIYNFAHYSMSGFITEELTRRGLENSRDNMRVVGNELRKDNPTYIVEKLYERAKSTGGNVIIESLRTVGEVKCIQELGGIVIGVDADQLLRYERAVARGEEKDKVSLEKFIEQEHLESSNDDEAKQNIAKTLELSDYIVHNNGTKEELHAQIARILDHTNSTQHIV